MAGAYQIRRLGADDVAAMRGLNAMFAQAFDDPGSYGANAPDDAYLRDVLGRPHVIALAAVTADDVIGGLVAYELDKLEQARREIYIYDLAVAEPHRRQGIATALIGALGEIGARRGAWVMFVQADYVDPPAVALYEKLGRREEVLHFDIAVGGEC